MFKIKYKNIIFIVLAGIFLVSIILGLYINDRLESPRLCSSCHEMLPYYSSYIKPQNGSLILSHNLTCIPCHSRKSIEEAKKIVAEEIISYKLNLSGLISFDELKPDCTKCHIPKSPVHNTINRSNCADCHWAHLKLEGQGTSNVTLRSIIPYGPHENKTCQDCHGINFDIPRCINCHSGHGGQKLENSLCLDCHTDPHVPKKPGILPNNTVYFKQNLPFSVCQPCHESQYSNMTGIPTGHNSAMDTCTKCHTYHGEKPTCSKCHKGMMRERHPSDFKCRTCHAPFEGEIKITCQDCHGKNHDWSKFTAIINPK
jgi:hypothetical protein